MLHYVQWAIEVEHTKNLKHFRFLDLCINITFEAYLIDCIRSHRKKTCKNMLNSNLKPCIQCVCLLQCSAHKCDFLKMAFFRSLTRHDLILTITRHRKLRLTRFWCHFKAKTLSFRMISKSQFWFWGPYCSFRYDAPHMSIYIAHISARKRSWRRLLLPLPSGNRHNHVASFRCAAKPAALNVIHIVIFP